MVTEPTSIKPTVLVVEDEMLLRMRAVDIVEDAGFNPLEAVNAEDALVLLESRSDIDLLFTDIQLPGAMNGLKLAYAVHERWPSIKIILVSGQVTPGEAERPTDSRFFAKPVEVQHLTAELQNMIGRGALKIVPSGIAARPILGRTTNHASPVKMILGQMAKLTFIAAWPKHRRTCVRSSRCRRH